MALDHIIFDFFGTLVDYSPGHFEGEQYKKTHTYLLQQGHTMSHDELVLSFSRVFKELEDKSKISHKEFHMHDVGKIFFDKHFGRVADAIIEQFTDIYLSEWNRNVNYFPNIDSFLTRLRKYAPLSIISNTHYAPLVHNHLEAMQIRDHFSLVVTSIEHGYRKPNKKIFHDTLKQLSAVGKKTIYIGDSLGDDYEGAKHAGLLPILIDQKGLYKGKITPRVDSLFEIEALIVAKQKEV